MSTYCQAAQQEPAGSPSGMPFYRCTVLHFRLNRIKGLLTDYRGEGILGPYRWVSAFAVAPPDKGPRVDLIVHDRIEPCLVPPGPLRINGDCIVLINGG